MSHFFVPLATDHTFGMGTAAYDQCVSCNVVRVRVDLRADLYLVDGDIIRAEPGCVVRESMRELPGVSEREPE